MPAIPFNRPSMQGRETEYMSQALAGIAACA